MVLEMQLLFGIHAQVMAGLHMLLVQLVAHMIQLRLDRAETLVKVGLDDIVVVRKLLEIDRHLDHLD